MVPKAFTLARGRPWMPDLLSVSPALRYVYLILTAFFAQCHTPPLLYCIAFTICLLLTSLHLHPPHTFSLLSLSILHGDCRFASMLPAVLLTMLFYLDQNISVRAVNACNLKKVRPHTYTHTHIHIHKQTHTHTHADIRTCIHSDGTVSRQKDCYSDALMHR